MIKRRGTTAAVASTGQDVAADVLPTMNEHRVARCLPWPALTADIGLIALSGYDRFCFLKEATKRPAALMALPGLANYFLKWRARMLVSCRW